MSPVELKKMPCRPVDLRVKGLTKEKESGGSGPLNHMGQTLSFFCFLSYSLFSLIVVSLLLAMACFSIMSWGREESRQV